MRETERNRLPMNAQIRVIGGLELVRQRLNRILGKQGTMESLYEFLGWAEKVFAEAKEEIAKVIGISPNL